MKSYIVMKLNSGRWAILEKRFGEIVAKANTREEAIEKLKEIKAADKAAREAKKAFKEEVEKLANEYTVEFTGGNGVKYATTKSGKKIVLYGNCGLEKRSRYCYTLYIENECVFTSGTIEKAIEYILQN